MVEDLGVQVLGLVEDHCEAHESLTGNSRTLDETWQWIILMFTIMLYKYLKDQENEGLDHFFYILIIVQLELQ